MILAGFNATAITAIGGLVPPPSPPSAWIAGARRTRRPPPTPSPIPP